jgi:hypothetical protein
MLRWPAVSGKPRLPLVADQHSPASPPRAREGTRRTKPSFGALDIEEPMEMATTKKSPGKKTTKKTAKRSTKAKTAKKSAKKTARRSLKAKRTVKKTKY